MTLIEECFFNNYYLFLGAVALGIFSHIVPALHYIFSFFKEKKEKDAVSIGAKDKVSTLLPSLLMTIKDKFIGTGINANMVFLL